MNLKSMVNESLQRLKFTLYEKKIKDDFFRNFNKYEIYNGTDKAFNEQVLPFWEKYNYKPDKRWYQFFGYKDKKFDSRFIPKDYLYSKLMPFLNNLKFENKISNIIFIDSLFYDVNRPTTLVKNCRGNLVDKDFNLITEKEVLDILVSEGKSIIKSSGNEDGDINDILNFEHDRENALSKFKTYLNSGDFIVQKIVKKSEQMKKLNASNNICISISSLLVNDKVEILSKILRTNIDNLSSNNDDTEYMCREILNDNTLSNKALIDNKLIEISDNTYEKLIGIDEAIDIVKKIHPRVLHARFISWNFTFDEYNKPVLISLNTNPKTYQRLAGPVFGDFTKSILDEYFALESR